MFGVLAKYGLAEGLQAFDVDWIQKHLRSFDGTRLHDHSFEARVRLALLELGTTFIKFGQTLSTRPDLVGNPLAKELEMLQADTPADPPETVAAKITAELGAPPEVLFATFEATAFASASIAQVHRATLSGGEQVVVKVIRNGVREQAATDLEILSSLARLAEKHVPALAPCRPVLLVRQLQRRLRRELDFRCERRNLERLGKTFAGEPLVRFPGVYPAYCTSSVLTMDYLDGVAAADLVGLRSSGVDLGAFARRGAQLYIDMIFRDGFYHADPHPGNLLLLPGGALGVLDCGMVGRLDENLREDVLGMVFAAADGDAAEVCEAVLRIGMTSPDTDRAALRAEFAEFLSDFVDLPLADLDVAGAITSLIDLVSRYRIALPAQLSLLLRTVVVLEGTSRALDRRFSLAELMASTYEREARRRLSPRRLIRRARRTGRDWQRLVDAMPRDLRRILDTLGDGSFRVQFSHRNLDARVDRLVHGMVVAALILGASWLWVSPEPRRIGTSFLAISGYALSLWLGWRLWRRRRSVGTESD
ncbi:MAG: putative ubiquinone biosynthesis protein UbiB [Planctomycetota bacterium]